MQLAPGAVVESTGDASPAVARGDDQHPQAVVARQAGRLSHVRLLWPAAMDGEPPGVRLRGMPAHIALHDYQREGAAVVARYASPGLQGGHG